MIDHLALDKAFTEHKNAPTETTLHGLLALVRDSVYRRTRDDDAAQDLVVYLMLNLDTIAPRATFSRWLSGAIRHRRLDSLQEMAQRRAAYQPLDDRLTVPVRSYSSRMEVLAADVCDQPVEHALIESMLDGKTLRQAAHEMQIGETAARNRLRRLGHKLIEKRKHTEEFL